MENEGKSQGFKKDNTIIRFLIINLLLLIICLVIARVIIYTYINNYQWNHIVTAGIIIFVSIISFILFHKEFFEKNNKYKVLIKIFFYILNLLIIIILSGPLWFILPPLYNTTPEGIFHFINVFLFSIALNFMDVILFIPMIIYQILI
ncbi:MAG: hypothetical protein AAB116_24760 [Candidatus Poribacteria bacterium]